MSTDSASSGSFQIAQPSQGIIQPALSLPAKKGGGGKVQSCLTIALAACAVLLLAMLTVFTILGFTWSFLWFAGSILALFALIFLAYRAKWKWTGFSGKTLWDWLQLAGAIAIPIFVVFFTVLQAHDLQIAAEQQQETVLNTYLDKMTDLLLTGNLRDPKLGVDAQGVARARTLTALRQLDSTRKGVLLGFLIDESLVLNRDHPLVNLAGADFSGANLEGFQLMGADLAKVDLSGADLTGANLSSAYLSNANLSDAHLNNAIVCYTQMSEVVNLSEADLTGAHLSGSDLIGANLSQANLSGANLGSKDKTCVQQTKRTDIMGADLSNANLDGANLSNADLTGVLLTKTVLTNVVWKHTTCSDTMNSDAKGAGSCLGH